MRVKKFDIRAWMVVSFRGAKIIVARWFFYRFEGLWMAELVEIYWRIQSAPAERPAFIGRCPARYGFFAGFCSQSRGLSWDRRSRYGEK